jgi:hypothetical protein
MGFNRAVALIALAAIAQIVATNIGVATIPVLAPVDLSESPEERKLRLEKLRQIPYVQLAVEYGPDRRFPLWTTNNRCFFDAIVRRSFQRQDVLPVGMHVRVASDCTVERHPQFVEIRPGDRVDIDREPLMRDLNKGSLLQMHLRPVDGAAKIFDKIGEVIVLDKLTNLAVDDSTGEQNRAGHLNDFGRLDGVFGPVAATAPAFPVRDVVVTYRNTLQPGRLFRAYYQSATWRMRLEEVDAKDARAPVVIDDAFAATEAWIWVRSMSYAIQMTSWENRFGLVIRAWDRIFETEGTDHIAGLDCTKYYVHVPPTIAHVVSAHVCLTGDGVALRHSQIDGSWSEAVEVHYESVTRDLVTIPENFHELPDPHEGTHASP